MKLVTIPNYEEYKLKAIFDCYKWDPQFLDNFTLAKHALVLTEEEYKEVKELTVKLDNETLASEEFLNNNLALTKKLALPKKISKELKTMTKYDKTKHVRLMRYDFHPTIENKWAVSEVNSDVPGGFAEASLLPQLAIKHIENDSYYSICFGDILGKAIKEKVRENANIMFVHCTSYSDDRQVMQYIGDKLSKDGYNVMYGAADHIEFRDLEAYSILNGHECKLDFIFRFTPLEWLKDIKPKKWDGYFNTITPSCNHPIAIFAQTKRFPLIWDLLEQNNINLTTWKELLPDTIEVKNSKNKEGYIFKPACGRVGEKISIKEACDKEEYELILKDVKKHPKDYLAQKQFISKPILSPEGNEFHVCLGSYTINNEHAGFYARISSKTRIDSDAQDIPVLIERSNNNE